MAVLRFPPRRARPVTPDRAALLHLLQEWRDRRLALVREGRRLAGSLARLRRLRASLRRDRADLGAALARLRRCRRALAPHHPAP